MGSHAAPRLPDFSYRGLHAYAITCCTWHRHPWFTYFSVVDIALTTLRRVATAHAFDLLAYCFMPDHVHLLVEATSAESDLRSFANEWKQRTGFAHRRITGQRLWQAGYHDHVLRGEEAVLSITAYVVANPVRAKLVENLREYPYWGSGRWSRDALIEAVAASRRRGG